MAKKTVEQVEHEFIERYPDAMKPGSVVGNVTRRDAEFVVKDVVPGRR